MTPEQTCRSKVQFRTKSEAKDSIARWKRRGVRYFAYECPVCKRFHLSHIAPADYRAAMRRTA